MTDIETKLSARIDELTEQQKYFNRLALGIAIMVFGFAMYNMKIEINASMDAPEKCQLASFVNDR